MPAPSKITLYDFPSILPGKTLSPYAVRIRLLLDYRQISYESAWVDFPDIEATAKSVGAPPTWTKVDGSPGYTIPFIVVESHGKATFALSDSFKIAQYIEDIYPDPDSKLLPVESRVLQSVFSNYVVDAIRAANKIFLPALIRALPEHTRDWFIESRKRTLGRDLKADLTDEAGIAAAWKEFDSAFDNIAAHLDKAGDGNFHPAGEISYSEFALVSILYFFKRISFDECWKRLESRNGGRWVKLLDMPLYKKLLPDD